MKLRHSEDGRVHHSELKQMASSSAHYRHACLTATEPTRPMIVGAVADRIVFPNGKVAVFPSRRVGKEWAEFQAAHQGDVICNQAEYDDAAGAAAAVMSDPVAGPILRADGNEFQRVMQWSAYGIECAAGIAGKRGGFDLLNQRESLIADLKITADAEPDALQRHALRMFWHTQGRWYLDGAQALALDATRFALICVEASPPHPVTVLRLGPGILDLAAQTLSLWVERLRACEAADQWPGYVQSAVEWDQADDALVFE